MNLDKYAVILTTTEGAYVWSKHQNEYFWGGLGNSIMWYSWHYAHKYNMQLLLSGHNTHVTGEAGYKILWQHKLSGKDRFDGLARDK